MPVLTFENGLTMDYNFPDGRKDVDYAALSQELLATGEAEAPAWLTEPEELFRIRHGDTPAGAFHRTNGRQTGLTTRYDQIQREEYQQRALAIGIAQEVTQRHGGLTQEARNEIRGLTGNSVNQILEWIPIEGPDTTTEPPIVVESASADLFPGWTETRTNWITGESGNGANGSGKSNGIFGKNGKDASGLTFDALHERQRGRGGFDLPGSVLIPTAEMIRVDEVPGWLQELDA